MKMKLLKHWWMHMYMMIAFAIIFDVVILSLHILNPDMDGHILLTVMFIIDLIIGETIFESRKYLMTMEIQKGILRSYRFGRLKCEVFTNKNMYYAIFECYEPLKGTNKYIAVSNEKFVCEKRKKTLWSRNEFIDYYDRTKQIMFPYNERTKQLFPIEKWTRVS